MELIIILVVIVVAGAYNLNEHKKNGYPSLATATDDADDESTPMRFDRPCDLGVNLTDFSDDELNNED